MLHILFVRKFKTAYCFSLVFFSFIFSRTKTSVSISFVYRTQQNESFLFVNLSKFLYEKFNNIHKNGCMLYMFCLLYKRRCTFCDLLILPILSDIWLVSFAK